MMSRACAAISNLNFSNDDSSSSEEDERPKRKTGDFTGLCLMGKASRHISDSDSDVSDDSSPKSLSLRVVELENALCKQDKLLCKVFRENKKLNLDLKSASSEIASLRSPHDDMSANPCDNCTIIMIKYVDLWHIHSHVASLLDGARLELRELKTVSLDALDTAHVLIVVIIFCVGQVSLLEGLTLTLSRDTWTVHAFLVMVHVALGQMVSWKGLLRLLLVAWLSAGFLRFISLTPARSHGLHLILCR
jgi:hypothetical protein